MSNKQIAVGERLTIKASKSKPMFIGKVDRIENGVVYFYGIGQWTGNNFSCSLNSISYGMTGWFILWDDATEITQ